MFVFLAISFLFLQFANASSHSEAPGTASSPKSDLVDVYAFTSYEPGRSDYVTLIANINGLQDTFNGPNYSPISSDFVYNIHIENTGDGVEDLTFQFVPGARFSGPFNAKKGTGNGLTLNVPWDCTPGVNCAIEGQRVALAHIGQVTNTSTGFNEDSLNYKEHYVLRVFNGPAGKMTNVDQGPFASNVANGSTEFRIPFSYAGRNTFPGTDAGVNDYEGYARSFVYDINIPNCPVPGKVFVGQRKEPFHISLGRIFDVLNINPLGPNNPSNNILARKAVTSFTLEVPKQCLTDMSTQPVIGVYASVQHLGHVGPTHAHVAGAQKNRLANPLVNELLIGLTDKDRYNAAHPRNDEQFKTYTDYPTIAEIIDIVFRGPLGAPSNVAPNNLPRADLTTVLLQGVPPIAALGGYTTQQTFLAPSTCGTVSAPPFADLLRLNVAFPPTPRGTQDPLAVLGGADLAGFPNGRRPGDDTVDIFMRVGMGALCHPPFDTLLGVCTPANAPIGNAALGDEAPVSAMDFDDIFPYLRTPVPGSDP